MQLKYCTYDLNVIYLCLPISVTLSNRIGTDLIVSLQIKYSYEFSYLLIFQYFKSSSVG